MITRMRFALPFLVVLITSLSAFSATDSLVIQGRILNLNGRLYRQAPNITFSRNNILQPQTELSKQAALAPDGGFRVSLPMIYSKEEIYLDYGGLAFVTFLGSPGTIDIVFDGDSIKTAKKLFFFAGENAEVNNQYQKYRQDEALALKANTLYGSKFYDTFWGMDVAQAASAASKRSDLRKAVLNQTAQFKMQELSEWGESVIEDERLQNLLEYSLSNQLELNKNGSIIDSLKRLSNPPLTSQRVTLANRFGNYGDEQVAAKKGMGGSRTNSLPVRLMAKLIKDNAASLTEDDLEKLNDISSKGIAEKIELDFLNALYAKNEMVLNLLFNFEREGRIYGDLFDSTAREFLKARYLPKNFYKYTYQQQSILSKHIQSRLSIPQFARSLDEIVRIEVKDSADIRKMIAFKNVKGDPTEILPGYYLSASNDRGSNWFNNILEKYSGRTIYVVKWNIDDQKSREEMEYIATLEAQLPEDILFLFLHVPIDESLVAGDLVKQYIVRQKLKGVHLFLNSNQTMDLLFKLNPVEPGTFAIIKPNGKFALKNGPAPSAMNATVQAILNAEK